MYKESCGDQVNTGISPNFVTGPYFRHRQLKSLSGRSAFLVIDITFFQKHTLHEIILVLIVILSKFFHHCAFFEDIR